MVSSVPQAFIFMLAVRDVSAARESFNVAEMVTLAANTMEQSSQFHDLVPSLFLQLALAGARIASA